MKKTGFAHITLGLALLGLNSAAFAQVANTIDKKKSDPSLSSYLGDKPPPYNNPNRFLFEASFIYWQADLDGIDYSLEQDYLVENHSKTSGGIVPLTTTDINFVGLMKNKDLKFKWEPGFKVGIGVLFGDMDEWDLVLNWTWIEPKAHRVINNVGTPDFSPIETSLNPTLTLDYQTPGYSPTFSGSPAVNSSVKWRMLYNTIDFELGRHFFLAKNLTMRPHVGIRGALLNQMTKVSYNLASNGQGFFPLSVFTAAPGQSLVDGNLSGKSGFKGKNNYDAVGLRGGLDLRWNFTNHFCTYGSLAGSILYGRFKIRETFSFDYTNTVVDLNSMNINRSHGVNELKSGYRRTRTNLQAIVGVMWHTDFNKDKQHITASAGYEVNEWFQQNELRDIQGILPFTLSSHRTNGDLGLHGFNVDVSVDF